MHGTASHVETQVRLYRKTKRIEALEEENLRHGHRELSWYIDDDGYWVFKGRFTPEQGAMLQKALEAAGDQLFEEQQNVPAEVAHSFMTGFPDMVLIMDELEVQADKAIFHWTFIGTNSGPDGTGNKVHFSGFEEWSIGEDGLIAQSDGNFDNDEYQHQLAHGVDF